MDYQDICLIDCKTSKMTFGQVMDAIAEFRSRYDCHVYIDGGDVAQIRARVFGARRPRV